MPPPSPDDVVGLAMMIRGRVILPVNTREYQAEVERSHNAGFWNRTPLMFIMCHDADDAKQALEFCTRLELPLSIRGGGHSACGSSIKNDSVVIDLSRMRHIQYDPSTEEVIMQAGCNLGDVNVHLLRHGRMTPIGVAPPTGVGGLCLHGGLGHLAHCCSTAVDNITSLDIILADGTSKTVGYNSTGEDADLFFAARGHASNIGIVTSLTMKTYPMRMITAGIWMMLDDDQYTSTRVLTKLARDMVLAQDEAGNRKLTGALLMGNVPPDPSIPENLHGAPCTMAMCGAWGDDEDAASMLKAFVDREIIFGRPPAPMPFNVFNQILAGMFLNPPPFACYFKGVLTNEIPDDVFDKFADTWVGHDPATFGASMVGVGFMGGKGGKEHGDAITKGKDHCVSSLRDYTFEIDCVTYFPNTPGFYEQGRELSQRLATVLDGYASASYSNYHSEVGRDSKDDHLIMQNRDRLQAIKKKVDPHNIFSRTVVHNMAGDD